MYDVGVVEFFDPAEVDTTGEWLFWAHQPSHGLVQSISRLGQLVPAVVTRGKTGVSLVTGYSRLLVLQGLGQKIAANVVDGNAYALGMTYLSANFRQQFLPHEIIAALRFFSSLLPPERLEGEVVPLFGFEEGSSLWREYELWLRLPQWWDVYLAAGKIPVAAASILVTLRPPEWDALAAYFDLCEWQVDNGLDFVGLIIMASRHRGISVNELLNHEGFEQYLEQGISLGDGAKACLAAARQLHPVWGGAVERSLETKWSVTPSPQGLTLRQTVNSREALRRAECELQELAEADALKMAFEEYEKEHAPS